jgi:hypothetical protein
MMPQDRRHDLLVLAAMSEARPAVKADLKRRNAKPSHYASREIGRMALGYAREHWPTLRAQALTKIMGDARLRAEWMAAGLSFEAAMAKRGRPLCVLPRLA